MSIRKATISDFKKIECLLQQLGYSETRGFLTRKLKKLLADPDETILVYEVGSDVVAFISVHFIPQIALKGDFARISYFSVDDSVRSKGIGKEIETYVTALAKKRHCDRIEVHCHSRRADAHRFYFRQGFKESPKYLIKVLPNSRINRSASRQ